MLPESSLSAPSALPSCEAVASLPATSALLVQGGDYRIAIQPESQANKYGCRPFPDNDRIAFASSTASQISTQAFDVADRLRDRIENALQSRGASDIYRDELARLRGELLKACGWQAGGASVPDAIFAASGTDAHLLASHLVAAQARRPLRIIMVNPEESGSGVTTALSDALRANPSAGADAGSGPGSVMHVALREADGAPRSRYAIEADFDALCHQALQDDADILVVLIDVSKTGCIAPDPQYVRRLRLRWPDRVRVLVDACQFRMEMPTLRSYLAQDFMVAITGSKFIGGPSFSAALLVPASIAEAMHAAGAPAQLAQHCLREEWPDAWHPADTLPSGANFGLLLRWQAALSELQSLRAVPDHRVREFLLEFNAIVRSRLEFDPHFAILPAPILPTRSIELTPAWDDIASIHAFTLHRESGSRSQSESQSEPQPPLSPSLPLTGTEVIEINRRLQQTRHDNGYLYSVGQPVVCGRRDGVELSALRLCVSAGMIVQACTDPRGRAGIALIGHAMACLDAIAALIDQT